MDNLVSLQYPTFTTSVPALYCTCNCKEFNSYFQVDVEKVNNNTLDNVIDPAAPDDVLHQDQVHLVPNDDEGYDNEVFSLMSATSQFLLSTTCWTMSATW